MQNTYCLEKLKVKQHSSQKFWPTSVGKSRQISAHSSLYLTLPCNNIFSRSKQETQRVLEWRSCNNKTLESRISFRVISPALLDVCFKRCPITSDVVKDPKPRNPRGTTSTFKSPTRTRPRKLIPEQNPKPDIQTPKPRKSPKVLNLYIKYLKNTIKINNKNLEKFFFKIYYIFFFPSTFKSQKNNANIFVEFFF